MKSEEPLHVGPNYKPWSARRTLLMIASSALSFAALWFFYLKDYNARQCLESERDKFHSPSSVRLIGTLGKRGQDDYDGFWIHYAAKNGFGVEREEAMACTTLFSRAYSVYSGSGEWKRDTLREATLKVQMHGILLRNQNRRWQAAQEKGQWGFDAVPDFALEEEASRLIRQPTKLLPEAILNAS